LIGRPEFNQPWPKLPDFGIRRFVRLILPNIVADLKLCPWIGTEIDDPWIGTLLARMRITDDNGISIQQIKHGRGASLT
jgi:hypothetical protein